MVDSQPRNVVREEEVEGQRGIGCQRGGAKVEEGEDGDVEDNVGDDDDKYFQFSGDEMKMRMNRAECQSESGQRPKLYTSVVYKPVTVEVTAVLN